MSSSDQRSLNERRASFRCPATGPRRAGRLRIGKREYPVEVLDESAGGYSVVCEQALDCEVGQSLLLWIESSWSIARIMNVQAGEGNTRLGLLRLKDLDDSEADTTARVELSLETLKQLARALAPLGRRAVGVVSLLVGGALVGVGVMVVLERSAPLADAIKHDDSDNIENMAFPEAPPLGEAKTSDEETEPRKRKDRATKRPAPAVPGIEQPAPPIEAMPATASPRRERAPEPQVAEHVVRHSHPGLMLKPEFVKLLDLTHAQVNEFRRLFEETRSSTAAALREDADSAGSQHELDLEVGKRTLSVLTPAQREMVTRMLSNKNTDPGAADSPSDKSDK